MELLQPYILPPQLRLPEVPPIISVVVPFTSPVANDRK